MLDILTIDKYLWIYPPKIDGRNSKKKLDSNFFISITEILPRDVIR